MTTRTVVVTLALACAWLGCSKPEPEPQKQAAPAATKVAAPAAPAPAPSAGQREPVATLPTVDVKPPPDSRPRYPETPCDRHEAGWKWVGTIVENGQCIVGPCACVKE